MEGDWQPQHYLYDFLAADAVVAPSVTMDVSGAPLLPLLDTVTVEAIEEWPVPFCPAPVEWPVPFCPGPETPGSGLTLVLPVQDITHLMTVEYPETPAMPPVKTLSTMQSLQLTSNLGLPMMV